MTAKERISSFLRENLARAYCDDCLSSLLKIKPRQSIQQNTSTLAKDKAFQRASGRCAHCKGTKLVIGLFAGENAKKDDAYLSAAKIMNTNIRATDDSILAEDEIKRILERWLSAEGWSVEIAWAKTRGIDIHARRNKERWVIEVKGGGSLSPMRVNYFLGILGETLQRMDDPDAMYSIALPDLKQFRNLWTRLPSLAKERTQITALFVTRDGKIDRVTN